jgi:hypothetical protein
MPVSATKKQGSTERRSSRTSCFKKIKAPEEWKYDKKWLDRNFGESSDYYRGKDKIGFALRSEDASSDIRRYIEDAGPTIVSVRRHINRFIDILEQENYLEDYDRNALQKFKDRFENFPCNQKYFRDKDEYEDMLYAHNYKKCPDKLVETIDYIMNKMHELNERYNQILEFIEYKIDIEMSKLLQHDFNKNKNQISDEQQEKWQHIEMKHTKVKEGIIYVLSNELMPGIYKIDAPAKSQLRNTIDVYSLAT